MYARIATSVQGICGQPIWRATHLYAHLSQEALLLELQVMYYEALGA